MGHAAFAGVRIGGSSLRANGQIAEGYQYSGPCPVDLKFGWGSHCLDAFGRHLYVFAKRWRAYVGVADFGFITAEPLSSDL